jgi:transcriptional regulator with XRE-family HTH domain
MAAAGRAPASRRLREFGDFLRSRRARLRPADVGLPDGTRRRTPGLRREEVAQLSGVSPTYYAFLEQGRDISPSDQVLDALARALRLSPAERDHVYALAQRGAPRGGDAPETLSAGIAALVERLDPYPSFVKGRRWDILAANRAARALFTDWLALPPGQRNELLWMFTDPRARDTYVDWEKDAAAMLARFRLAAARRPDDPDFAAVIEHLHRGSAEARSWWSRHEVLFPASGTKRLRHQLLGEMTFDHVVLQVVDDPDQKLVTFSTPDGNREPLTRLAATIAS